MRRVWLVVSICIASAHALAQGQVQRPELKHVSFIVRLTAPISTKTSNAGDTFAALVEAPAQYQGAVFSGRVTSVQKPKKGVGKGKAQIAFRFDSLTAAGNTFPVTADVKDVVNSKGVKSVDDEGQVIGKTSNNKRVAAAATGAGLGLLIGGLAGGAKGAAVGGAAGLGAGVAIGLTMTTTGTELEFLPGSQFTLDVSNSAPKQ